MAREPCPYCVGDLADDSHPAALNENAAHSAEPSPGDPCRCQELVLLGLLDQQNMKEMKQRISERIAEAAKESGVEIKVVGFLRFKVGEGTTGE